jgi:hypothetical protein
MRKIWLRRKRNLEYCKKKQEALRKKNWLSLEQEIVVSMLHQKNKEHYKMLIHNALW